MSVLPQDVCCNQINNAVLIMCFLRYMKWAPPYMVRRGRDWFISIGKHGISCIPSAALLFLASWLFAAMENLPNGLNLRMHLTLLFIKRNTEQKSSLSCAPMTTKESLHQAMEKQPHKACEAPIFHLPVIHSGPGGVKVSAKTFTPLVHLNREMEWWQEKTRGDGGGQVALFNDAGVWWECC